MSEAPSPDMEIGLTLGHKKREISTEGDYTDLEKCRKRILTVDKPEEYFELYFFYAYLM